MTSTAPCVFLHKVIAAVLAASVLGARVHFFYFFDWGSLVQPCGFPLECPLMDAFSEPVGYIPLLNASFSNSVLLSFMEISFISDTQWLFN